MWGSRTFVVALARLVSMSTERKGAQMVFLRAMPPFPNGFMGKLVWGAWVRLVRRPF